MKLVCCFLWVISAMTSKSGVTGQYLISYFSQNGLHGEITFHPVNSTTIEIQSRLETTLQYPNQVWSWAVHQFPVDYSDIDTNSRCELNKLGIVVVSFTENLNFLVLPGNESSIWYKEMNLIGDNGIWGKSLVLEEYNSKVRICATITTAQKSMEHMAEAKFNTPIAGSVFFRWLAPSDGISGDTIIYSNLYHIQFLHNGVETNKTMTKHNWKIFVTDILKTDHHRSESNCNFLQLVFDPQGNGEGKGIGDLNNRLGQIRVSKNPYEFPQQIVFRDHILTLYPSDLTIPHRTLYLVLFDGQHQNNFLACTKIRNVEELTFKTFLNSGGVKADITFTQRSKFDPTFINFTVQSVNDNIRRKFAEDVAQFRISDLPPSPNKKKPDNCYLSETVYNPLEIQTKNIPPPGYGTQDQYPIGDITGKLHNRNKNYYHQYQLPGLSSELSGLYWDIFLPMQGSNSIALRGFVVFVYNRTDVKNITKSPWDCASINLYKKNGLYQKTIITAQVLFRYPIVGRVLFRQPAEEPWQDTSIIFEFLIHADGSTINNTIDHRWAVHQNSPGKDFYDWQNRCLSSGSIYNPFKVNLSNQQIEELCKIKYPAMCPIGLLDTRLEKIKIAGSKNFANKLSRRFFTDSNLPLSGQHSVLGKSLVIYDDFGPKARGERLACAIIAGHYRRKVLAKDWYANGDKLSVTGKVEIIQQTEYDLSNIEVQLKGLNQNSGYHVHMTPVEANLEFPCESSTLYGHWNPFNVSNKLSPSSKEGTVDQYEMGDLSGKFGSLDSLTQYEGVFNDTNLSLFGYNSIIGRSIVIHKKKKNARWACSTLERGYSPSEAREIRAIASFHHPTGYAYGYIKMTQLIHNDGSQSDTVIEIKLRHPGKNDRNMTYNHNWQIWVNPVGVDASVKPTLTRCVAGGYVWNPYYTQLADPLNHELYTNECGRDNPLRCYVGDISARLGPIDIGGKRLVLTDSNFPLESPVGAMGRSIVIFGPEYSNERFACANIEPDHNVIKYVNLQKPPRFVVAQFLEDLRAVMGIPEWMLDVDARKTKQLHGGACIQMIIHFKGPIAHRLELDMSRLIAAGRLDAPSLYIAGYVNLKRKATISYRTCGVRDPNEKRIKSSKGGIIGYSGSDKVQIKLVMSVIILIAIYSRMFVLL